MKYPFLFSLLLSACALQTDTDDDVEVQSQAIYTENLLAAREYAYMAYDLAYEAPTAECKTEVRHLSRTYLDKAPLQATCGSTAVGLEACTFVVSGSVYVLKAKSNDVQVHAHEFLHALLYCERDNSDHGHIGPAFAMLNILIY